MSEQRHKAGSVRSILGSELGSAQTIDYKGKGEKRFTYAPRLEPRRGDIGLITQVVDWEELVHERPSKPLYIVH